MKAFYLLRHEDVHGNSGTGVVAEGTIFWDGTGSFTWYSHEKTVTSFTNIRTIRRLHSHGGRTEVVVAGGSKANQKKFEMCQQLAHDKKNQLKLEAEELKKHKRGVK